MLKDGISQPLKRSRFRRKLGKAYYSFKRNLKWLAQNRSFAKNLSKQNLQYLVKEHQSFLLRPLKDVDMQLQHNKVTNLKLAAEKINQLIIKPGEVFSFWYLVGKPLAKKGYLPGLVLNQGNIESGVGGGLCQIGNLLFWMAIHSPLTITERYRHGFDVFPDVNRKVPFGAGATLSYNYIDLQIKNNTQQDFQIKLFLSDEYLHGEIRSNLPVTDSYEIKETDHRIVHQVWGGYTRHNRIIRTVTNENGESREEQLLENHAVMMYEPLLEG